MDEKIDEILGDETITLNEALKKLNECFEYEDYFKIREITKDLKHAFKEN